MTDRPDNAWISLEKAREAFGWTEGQLRSKIARRWRRGVQWASMGDTMESMT